MHWIGPYSLKCIHVHVYIFWYSFQANIFYFGFLFGLENLRRQKPALYISLQTKYPLGNKCGNVAWNRFFFFYWKDCLGVYVSDIKRNQILLLSSTHLNIILRFDFKIAALWQSSRNVLSSFNSNIYAFLFPFSIREWTRLKNYENEFYGRHLD